MLRLISRLAMVAAALLCVASAPDASAAPAGKGRIRWIADDWPRALAEARKRDVLVVVDAWAPW